MGNYCCQSLYSWSRLSSPEEPWNMHPVEFNDWYKETMVDGLREFMIKCDGVVKAVVQVIQQHIPLDVKDIVTIGSLAKETLLTDLSDFDCVVFVNPPCLPYLKDVRDISSYVDNQLADAIQQVAQALESNSTVTVVRKEQKRFGLVAIVHVSETELDVKIDVLLTADNLSHEGKEQLYESMLQRPSPDDREFYSPGLVRLQNIFINEKPGVVKELIRFVKYWNKCTVRPSTTTCFCRSRRFPTSYSMELITIYVWERAGKPLEFDRLQGFKAVLVFIDEELHSLHHYWKDNYSDAIARRGIEVMTEKEQERPLILDPANPTNNVCAPFHKTWDEVAKVARKTLSSNLLQGIALTGRWQFYV